MNRLIWHHTGHGYGHAVRTTAAAAHLTPEVDLELVGPVPETFFRAKLGRPFAYRPDNLDVGCRMAGALAVDAPATLKAVIRMLDRAAELAEIEAEKLVQAGADCLVSDSGWLPLKAARLAGIPAVLIASFTWLDIYAGLAGAEPGFKGILPRLAAEYDHLSLHLKPPLSLAGCDFGSRTRPVGLIAPQGRSRRAELLDRLGLAPDTRLGLIYLGIYGQDIWDTKALARLEAAPGWHWLGFEYDLPLANHTRLDSSFISHEDAVASSDAVLAKLGYSLLATALAAGTPLLFPIRGDDWPENPALEEAARAWPGGLGLSRECFHRAEAAPELARAAALRLQPIPAPGGAETARILADLCRSGPA